MTDHVQHSLLQIIKRSLAALRIAVADAQNEPTKTLVSRVVEESETLSAAIKSFAKRVDLGSFNTVAPQTADKLDVEPLFAVCDMLTRALDVGVCGACGGVLKRLV